jgi:hypothetical protein
MALTRAVLPGMRAQRSGLGALKSTFGTWREVTLSSDYPKEQA